MGEHGGQCTPPPPPFGIYGTFPNKCVWSGKEYKLWLINCVSSTLVWSIILGIADHQLIKVFTCSYMGCYITVHCTKKCTLCSLTFNGDTGTGETYPASAAKKSTNWSQLLWRLWFLNHVPYHTYFMYHTIHLSCTFPLELYHTIHICCRRSRTFDLHWTHTHTNRSWQQQCGWLTILSCHVSGS